jgi:hypothetical protein
MRELDELIRDGLSEEAGRGRFDRSRWEPSVAELPAPRRRRARRRRVSPALAGVAVGAVLAAAIVAPLLFLSRLGSGTREDRSGQTVSPTPRPTGYVRHADLDDGLSITIPAAWTFHQDPSGPAEPRTILAVGSYALPIGGECAPAFAQRELPPDGALFWLIEWRDPTFAFPTRPPSFELDEGTHGFYECSVTSSYLIRFEEKSRYFQIHVSLGERAPDSVASEVLRALESIAVTAPVPDACPPEVASSGDPDCPEYAWLHAIVEAAGYEVTGNTGSAVVGNGGGVEFVIWTTEADPDDEYVVPPEPGYDERIYHRQTEADDLVVFTDGIRSVWTAQGFHLWVDANVEGSVPTEVLRALAKASLRVDYDAIDTRP